MLPLLFQYTVPCYLIEYWRIYNLTIIGSDNGLSPGRCQAIIWTNAGILLIGPSGKNFSEIFIKINKFSFMKMHFKMLSGKRRPFCVSFILGNVINLQQQLQPSFISHNLFQFHPNYSHNQAFSQCLTLIFLSDFMKNLNKSIRSKQNCRIVWISGLKQWSQYTLQGVLWDLSKVSEIFVLSWPLLTVMQCYLLDRIVCFFGLNCFRKPFQYKAILPV